jgi:hypothetical protein
MARWADGVIEIAIIAVNGRMAARFLRPQAPSVRDRPQTDAAPATGTRAAQTNSFASCSVHVAMSNPEKLIPADPLDLTAALAFALRPHGRKSHLLKSWPSA